MKNFFLILVFVLSLWLVIPNRCPAKTNAGGNIFKEKAVFLGKLPEGLTIIPKSLKYSFDIKSITYVAYNDKKENIVYLNNTPSQLYYAVLRGTPIFSPVKNRHAYIAASLPHGKLMFVVIDGKRGLSFDAIDHLIFSPDDSRYAYRAQKGDKECVVVDGKPGPFYDGIPIDKNMVFSPDSKHFAYVALKNNKCVLVVDGVEEKKGFNFIKDVIFSPDSAHISYKGRIEKKENFEKWCLVTDGKAGPAFNRILNVTYSMDSKHYAYIALKDRKMMLVFDGKEGESHDGVGLPLFSPDNRHFACAYMDQGKWHIEIDGKAGPSFDSLLKFYYSPDSSRYAYTAIKDKKFYCVVDGKISDGFKKIVAFKFSPDSSRYAYEAALKRGACVIVDGVKGPLYASVGEPYFSPDSKNVVYKGLSMEPKKHYWHTILNGIESPLPFYGIKEYHFSPDSKRLAYSALYNRGKSVMVVDGKMQTIVRINGMPFFSPDSTHIAYHAFTMDKKWVIFVDGKQLAGEYGGFMKGTPMVFDSPTHFHTIALNDPGPTFLRIEVDISGNLP